MHFYRNSLYMYELNRLIIAQWPCLKTPCANSRSQRRHIRHLATPDLSCLCTHGTQSQALGRRGGLATGTVQCSSLASCSGTTLQGPATSKWIRDAAPSVCTGRCRAPIQQQLPLWMRRPLPPWQCVRFVCWVRSFLARETARRELLISLYLGRRRAQIP